MNKSVPEPAEAEGTLSTDSDSSEESGPKVVPTNKNRWVACALAATLGMFGMHRFYVGEQNAGIVYGGAFFLVGLSIPMALYDALGYLPQTPFKPLPTEPFDKIVTIFEESYEEVEAKHEESSSSVMSSVSFEGQRDDETVQIYTPAYIGEMMGSGDDTQMNGKLYITDQRLAFRGSKWFSFSSRSEDIPLDSVKNVSLESGMIKNELKVNKFKFKILGNKSASELKETLHRAKQDSKKASSETSPTKVVEQESELDKLQKLKDLHEQGALSDEEFQSKKEQLLEQV